MEVLRENVPYFLEDQIEEIDIDFLEKCCQDIAKLFCHSYTIINFQFTLISPLFLNISLRPRSMVYFGFLLFLSNNKMMAYSMSAPKTRNMQITK